MKTQSIDVNLSTLPGHNAEYIMEKLHDCLREVMKEHYPKGVSRFIKEEETTRLSVKVFGEKYVDGQAIYNMFVSELLKEYYGELKITSFQLTTVERMEYVVSEPYTLSSSAGARSEG